MMCEHCEAHVKEALEAIDGVEEAVASHKEGTAVVTLTKDVDNDVMKAAVEKEDSEDISIDGGKKAGGEKRILHVEGMMCEHCEAHVKEALEAIDGVEEAVASHKEGTAVVTLTKDVDNNVMKTAVEKEDYTVTSIEAEK